MQTILGTFDDRQTAQRAVDQLLAGGFTRDSVHLQAVPTTSGSAAQTTSDRGMMGNVGSFFSNLFGTEQKEHAGNYSEVVRRGSSVVAVDASDDSEVETAAAILEQLGSVNVDSRAAQWKSEGWSGFDPNTQPLLEGNAGANSQTASVVQEELQVGKRTVDAGGLRIVKRMSETPVTQMVNLRQEKATIERKPVNRAATEADFANFKEGTFEVRETAEEAVIGKTARVVEEVSIGKDVTNRSETVSDTVRRTDVDVERIEGARDLSDAARASRKPS
jgi:uncharacterized protein (TIGR02271 family)